MEHYNGPYLQMFPDRSNPEHSWTNGYLPGGLQIIWEQAKKVGAQLEVLDPELSPKMRRAQLEGLIRPLTGLPDAVFLDPPAVSQVRFA